MAVKKFKPVTPGQRRKVIGTFEEITKGSPEKSLLKPQKRSGGRNSQGRMTMRYLGGGHKKRYRVI
ncbi:MAG: 50S ribosomal protein L2, partial [Bacteroidetes bacterium]|nr:50S ribosomal protein L2 [Bacteroidota bacterium]